MANMQENDDSDENTESDAEVSPIHRLKVELN